MATKLGVAFDASARPSTGVSLNHKLMVGPQLQVSIITHLIHFRSH